MSRGAVLLIDAYDSFSNNITSLLREELGVTTETIRIDDPRFVLNDEAFYAYLQHFDAVVAGPGPGHPEISEDVGLIAKLWEQPKDSAVPVLGICLGFQSLCVSHGCRTQRLIQPRHGLVTSVTHKSTSVFKGLDEGVLMTQYHSLHMLLSRCEKHERQSVCWDVKPDIPVIRPLAWDLDARNGPILMAVEHIAQPYVAVQFHPESICTSAGGKKLVANWWQQAQSWNATNRVISKRCMPAVQSKPVSVGNGESIRHTVQYTTIPNPSRLTAVDVVQTLTPHLSKTPLVLQSGTRAGQPLNPETGRFSILGIHDEASQHLRYCCSNSTLQLNHGDSIEQHQRMSIQELMQYLEDFIHERKASGGPAEVPFWGGLIGYISYEAGLSLMDVQSTPTKKSRPDLWFVFIERSIVIDHVSKTIYVLSTRYDDQHWLHEMTELLRRADCSQICSSKPTSAQVLSEPQADVYCNKVRECQEHLRAGSSYELCLTSQTTVHSAEASWSMYSRLSRMNPAPFGAYMQLRDEIDSNTGITIVGSSPERFLKWSREGRCQFRPIKGTVSKALGVDRAEAEAILRTQKEVAENLMIVDLIRHDLAGVSGVQNVRVPTLMSVEEYETVYQLVSVIEGDLDRSATGIAVLSASLPPGSMTGAPKRRSCELLRMLEDDQPRGLYSGVIGYMDVGGGGDFSVVIRTAFQWADEDIWRIGAGGAVTVLSTPEGEYDEMLVKRQRVLDVLVNP